MTDTELLDVEGDPGGPTGFNREVWGGHTVAATQSSVRGRVGAGPAAEQKEG